MRKTKIYRSILTCLACGALLCTPVFAARQHGHARRHAQSHAFSAQDFLSTVAQQQMLRVNLAKIVDQRSANLDVRKLSTQITEEQTDAYKKLSQIASKVNATLPKGIDDDGNRIIANLLKHYRADFDRAFLAAQQDCIHHEIDAFEQAAKDATNPVLKQYAAAELPDLNLRYQELKDFAHYHLGGK